LKALLTKNRPAEREDWTMVLRKLLSAVMPGVQPFRMLGKGLPGWGGGPRLTDRKHYKQ